MRRRRSKNVTLSFLLHTKWFWVNVEKIPQNFKRTANVQRASTQVYACVIPGAANGSIEPASTGASCVRFRSFIRGTQSLNVPKTSTGRIEVGTSFYAFRAFPLSLECVCLLIKRTSGRIRGWHHTSTASVTHTHIHTESTTEFVSLV